MAAIHFNYVTGAECRCPWGWDKDQEHLGKTAAKIDWLEGRPDMQGEREKAFIKYLKGGTNAHANYTDADKLLPWIVREWKKGRMVPSDRFPHQLVYDHAGGQMPVIRDEDDERNGFLDRGAWHDARDRFLGPTSFPSSEAELTVKALEDMKKHRQGIDVMQHKAHELFPKVKDFRDWQKEQDRDKRGEILHQFDDGWTVRRLQNAEEAKIEGEDMGHCVGGYGNGIEEGNHFIVSLRDSGGNPHATMELHGWNHNDEKPVPVSGMSVGQFYGKGDAPPLDEYTDRMNEWLEPYGTKAETFEPWWEEEYGVEGPDTYHDLMRHHDYGYYEYAPDDYNSAQIDAEEHGFEPPSLYSRTGPYWSSILGDLISKREYNRQAGQWEQVPQSFDKEKADNVWNLAHVGTDASSERYTEGGWDAADEGPRLQESVDELHKDLLDKYNQEEYQNADEAREAWSSPAHELVDHLKGLEAVNDYNLDRTYQPPWKQALPQVAPNQALLFGTPQDTPWNEWTDEQFPLTQEHYGGVTGRPPLYYRWVFTPEQGVMLSSNDDDHPSRVPYHTDMGGIVDQQAPNHGYAYRIGDGWRLTDWEHAPLEDPFIAAQVVRALRGTDGFEKTAQSGWQAVEYNWDRLHYGLPEPKTAVVED